MAGRARLKTLLYATPLHPVVSRAAGKQNAKGEPDSQTKRSDTRGDTLDRIGHT